MERREEREGEGCRIRCGGDGEELRETGFGRRMRGERGRIDRRDEED